MDSVLRLLGVARKAGRVEVGEEPVGAAARAHQAKVILTAADGADNSIRRAAHFAEAGKIQALPTPYTKGELGGAVGRSACTMLALTDIGLAAAIAEKLAQADPERCGSVAEELKLQAGKALQRQKERRAHEKNLQRKQRKPWAPPPKEEKPAPKAPVEKKPFAPRGKLTIKKKP
ncbi:L7Ae/L30e/S12e/Gadd45 family ribosomal protein [Pseudoflavonifractor phocaeensis]|mgnify:FL=1|uniref:L7Ae/L30e/S12e/Gadd45 family ribosomal protein n=1 Tax=Oscillospiraceae TaxID=216572 RepID=UPI00174C1753|nr:MULTISPECIES: 50S ribosomal protein L7 [Oscillospiraceae]MBM6886140.1 50S ribosomal protein L7 [Pseudoflavonifractor phocaeensis]